MPSKELTLKEYINMDMAKVKAKKKMAMGKMKYGGMAKKKMAAKPKKAMMGMLMAKKAAKK